MSYTAILFTEILAFPSHDVGELFIIYAELPLMNVSMT